MNSSAVESVGVVDSPGGASHVAPVGRILVITYHFPPDGAVGGLRWYGLSKYLARLGWEVHVITAADGALPGEVPGVHRHTCVRRQTLNDLYGKFTESRLKSRQPAEAPVVLRSENPERSPSLAGRIVDAFRMAARIALAFPDVGRGWVLRAARTARSLQRRYRFDLVITSGPPHSAHLAGLLATLGNSTVVRIVDMRDPWSGGNLNWPIFGMDPRWVNPLTVPLERAVLRRAQMVVVTTRELAAALRSAEPRLDIAHVSNGTDSETLPARTEERFDGVSIAYLGTMYAGRSLSTLIAALKSVGCDRPNDAKKIKVRVAGHMDPDHQAQLERDLTRECLTGVVEFYGRIPRPQALDLLRRSHAALVLAQDQHTQVPAKLYECVGIGIPTVVVTETDSAAASEARRIGAIVVENEDVVAMRHLLDQLLDGAFPTDLRATAPISHEALARQMHELLSQQRATIRQEDSSDVVKQSDSRFEGIASGRLA